MSAAFKVFAIVISIASLLAGVVHFVRGWLSNKAAAVDDTAERNHVTALQAAQAADRAAREKKFDAQAAAVRTPAGAGDLLRSVSRDDPGTN